jgi:cell wall-associated NlpC family hydrolase
MSGTRVVFAAAGLAAFLVFVATFSAGARTTGDGSSAPEEGATRVSHGTVTGASESELDAVRRDVAEEERLPDYSRVVDDASERRFDAPGWQQGATDGLAHGGSYATSDAGEARFKLEVPTRGDYTLYAWWPSKETNGTAVRFGVRSYSGTRWTTVDQSRDGGYWVEIGTYEMRAGDYQAVRVSAGDGVAVADAVALVRGVASPPPDDLAPEDGGPVSAGVELNTGDVTYRASGRKGRVTGRQLIRWGRNHMGTPYRLSPPAPCVAREKEDCSCFTRLVLRHFDKWLPDTPVLQFQYGHKVRSRKSNVRRGDLVFFKEHGQNEPITHVGMYSGNGHVLHASGYFGKVVNSEMRYIKGYYGARRIRPPQ